MYLISEVYTASAFEMDVKVGENKFHWNSTSMMPIGFVFRKCDLTEGGMLNYGAEVRQV